MFEPQREAEVLGVQLQEVGVGGTIVCTACIDVFFVFCILQHS